MATVEELLAEAGHSSSDSYSPSQALFDVVAGPVRAEAGLADLLSWPVVKSLNYFADQAQQDPLSAATSPLSQGALLLRKLNDNNPLETWATSKLVDLGLKDIATSTGLRPTTLPQEVVSFFTPLPGAGKFNAGEHLLNSALAYGGYKGAEAVNPDSTVAKVAGPLLALATAKGGTALVKGLTTSSERSAQTASNVISDLIGSSGSNAILSAPDNAVSPLGNSLTAAEIAQDPTVAAVQAQVAKNPEYGRLIVDALNKRETDAQDVLASIGQEGEQNQLIDLAKDRAEKEAAAKTAQENAAIKDLGLTYEGEQTTPMQGGETIRNEVVAARDDAYNATQDAWNRVDMQGSLDAKPALDSWLKFLKDVPKDDRAGLGGETNAIIKRAKSILTKDYGVMTVGDFKAFRSRIGRAAVDSSGNEKRILDELRSTLDGQNKNAAIQPAFTDPTNVDALYEAIASTRQFENTYNKGFVGSITKQTPNKLYVTAASDLLDKTLSKPEKAAEVVDKLGFDSLTATQAKFELLRQLKQAKDPQAVLNKYQDAFNILFPEQQQQLQEYAQLRNSSTGFEAYANLTNGMVPTRLYENPEQLQHFMEHFQNTDAPEILKNNFINYLQRKPGSLVDNLSRYGRSAEIVFGSDLPHMTTAAQELAGIKDLSKLATQASRGQSVTSQGAAIQRALDNAVQQSVRLPIVDSPALRTSVETLQRFAPFLFLKNPVGGLIAGGLSTFFNKSRAAQAAAVYENIGKQFADPSLYRPGPVQANKGMNLTDALNATAAVVGQPARQISNTHTSLPNVKTASPRIVLSNESVSDLLAQSSVKDLLNEAYATPTPTTVKVGKQNISIPSGEQYADPKLVKIVIQHESNNNPDAVSNKGAGGLMQLMSATAKELGIDAKDRFDPKTNVDGGSRYLQKQINTFGDVGIALAAYNWGPGKIQSIVDRMKADNVPVTWDELKKYAKIPSETRNYVNSILTDYA